VTSRLLDWEINSRHRSFLSAILGEDVGHMRSRTMRTLRPIHDLWVPKYVNLCYVIICNFIYHFVVTDKLRYLFQTTRCRTPTCSAVSPGGQPVRHDSWKDHMIRFQYEVEGTGAIIVDLKVRLESTCVPGPWISDPRYGARVLRVLGPMVQSVKTTCS
jgi:hypothetical protein